MWKRAAQITSYAGGLVLFATFVWLVVAVVSALYNRFTEARPA